MKKRIIVLVALLLIVFGSMSYAQGRTVTGRYWQGPLQFYKDQTPVNIGVDPIIINGTTYVPVRAMSQILGMTVNWNGQDRSIRITSDQTQAANLSYYTDQVTKAQNDLNKAKKDLTDQKKDYEDQIAKLKKERDDIQKKYDDLLKTGNYRYSGYGYGDIQSALNNNVSRPVISGKTVNASYSVSTRTDGHFDLSVSLSGTGTGVTNEGVRSYLESNVMPYFTRYGYYDGRYYDGRYYDGRYYDGRYYNNYYDSTIIENYRKDYGSYPSASKYRDLYYTKYGISLPSDYDYNYHYNYGYGYWGDGYWRDGYWRDGYYGYYGFSGVYISVVDSTNNNSYRFYGSSGGSVSNR